MTFLAAFLIFVGLIAVGTFQSRMSFYGATWPDVGGATFGCGLIVTGAAMLMGA